MRPLVVFAILLCAALAGCADAAPAGETDNDAAGSAGEFRIPGVRVGDVYRYAFGFKGQGFEAGGITDVKILSRGPMADGKGHIRDALHVLQESPDGSFRETYWVDANTMTQFRLERATNFTERSQFPVEPLRPLPMRKASYGNGTGTEDRYKEDPLFEDYSFFGGFGSDRHMPAVGQAWSIPGNFWLRDENELLASHTNLTGKVDKEVVDETWRLTRHVTFKLDWRQGENFETIDWSGSFSTVVPLAVETLRIIKAKIGPRTIEVSFNASLMAFQPGEEEEILRTTPAPLPERRATEYAAWQRAPVDGSGARLMFPLSEALATLDKDPTATQYFQAHAGAYLQVAHLSEVDTCGFNAQPYPGCHWFDWSGRFVAPDDWYLDFRVEKFADANGGAPAYIPYVSRDYPFETIFGIGGTPQPPKQPVVAAKGTQDYPARDTLAADAITMAGAIAAFKATAWTNLSALDPNVVVLFIDGTGYSYFLSREDWVFPSQNPELVFFYDEGPLVLERHTAVVSHDGTVMESRNFWHQVTQR